MNPDLPGSEVELVHTNLQGDSFFDLGDLDVFGLDRNAGSNPCAAGADDGANGGCSDLCLFSGGTRGGATCACSYGRLSADGRGCEEYEAFLMYSRVSRIESLQMYNASDLNAPLAPIESDELGRCSVLS